MTSHKDTAQLILFNKPFRVMSQFSPCDDKDTLANYISIKNTYPAGRLDYDSEGLLLLTDHGTLQHHISHPDHKEPKTYWVQVEGIPLEHDLDKLRQGITLKDGPCRPAIVKTLPDFLIWNRTPPIRHRANQPTSWLSITLTEGRNRQVRRMTAAIQHPTLRLIRSSIGPWSIKDIEPGKYIEISVEAPKKSMRNKAPRSFSKK
jgi:23S rRNA pseudouridine2457 synthase